jgi:ferric-dicitrate binding protein FerR (iron transport regulator)
MTDVPFSSESRDQDLAARIGVLRRQGQSLDASDLTEDAVVRALLRYRDAQDVAPRPEQSERVWAAIEAETAEAHGTEEKREPATVFAFPSAVRWAVAASVVMAAVVAWLVLTGTSEPVQVAAATSSIETYTAPDGSTVRLRPHSALYRVETDGERRYQLTGEAFFDVTTRPEPFIVAAGALRVQVLGTRFTAHTWGQPAVYLQEGRVQVSTGENGEQVTLQPGQRSALTADGTLAPPTAADSASALDWLRQEIAFESEPAASVVAELEQHFGVTIALPNDVARETLSGRIALTTPQQSLSDLGVVLGGRFERVSDGTYRFVRE